MCLMYCMHYLTQNNVQSSLDFGLRTFQIVFALSEGVQYSYFVYSTTDGDLDGGGFFLFFTRYFGVFVLFSTVRSRSYEKQLCRGVEPACFVLSVLFVLIMFYFCFLFLYFEVLVLFYLFLLLFVVLPVASPSGEDTRQRPRGVRQWFFCRPGVQRIAACVVVL